MVTSKEPPRSRSKKPAARARSDGLKHRLRKAGATIAGADAPGSHDAIHAHADDHTRIMAGTAFGDEGTPPWHHMADGTFRNPRGSPERSLGRMRHAGPFFFEMLKRGARKVDIPDGHVLPRDVATGSLEFHLAKPGDFITWLGHAAFLMRIGGLIVLTDPYLTANAGPAGLGPKRFVKCGVPMSDLPRIDVLVLSHNHYDHLDERALALLPHKSHTTVIVPLKLGSFFRERGFSRVVELDWHETHEVDGVAFSALPVVHWSRRSGFDTNKTLWAGFKITGKDHNLFFGGDSGYGPVFKELGEQYGPFDTALLGIGAYEPRAMMKASHATPEEAVQMAIDLKARRVVGMHWGTVLLTIEPPFEPPERFRIAGDAQGFAREDVWIMAIGETRPLRGWPSNS